MAWSLLNRTTSGPAALALLSAFGCFAGTPALADFDGDGTADIVAINRQDVGRTTLLVLSGASSHQKIIYRFPTGLHATDTNWVFKMGDIDGDGHPDLVAINRKDGPKTSIFALSFASNFQSFIVAVATGLHATDENWDFALADVDRDGRPDLVAINRKDGPKTSIFALSFASNFQGFVVGTATGLHATDANWTFVLADYDGDRRPDLFAINRQDGPRTSVHVLSFASNFQQFAEQIATGLHATNTDWAFSLGNWSRQGRPDLIAINRRNGPKTTAHVMTASSRYQKFVAHTITGLHATDATWDFDIANSCNFDLHVNFDLGHLAESKVTLDLHCDDADRSKSPPDRTKEPSKPDPSNDRDKSDRSKDRGQPDRSKDRRK